MGWLNRSDDSCDTKNACGNSPVFCDDGEVCNVDYCTSGECHYNSVSCEDYNYCTGDSCDSSNGDCEETPVNCGDNACTVCSCCTESWWNHATVIGNDCSWHTTSWDTTNGCYYTPVVCDNYDLLTVVFLTPLLVNSISSI